MKARKKLVKIKTLKQSRIETSQFFFVCFLNTLVRAGFLIE